MTNSDSTTRPKSPTFATVNLKKRNSSHQKTNKPQPKIHPDQPSKQHPSKYKKATKKDVNPHHKSGGSTSSSTAKFQLIKRPILNLKT